MAKGAKTKASAINNNQKASKVRQHARKIRTFVEKVPRKTAKKSLLFTLLFVVVLVLYFTVGLQVKILIAEEMDLDLSPSEKSFTVPYDSPPNITFHLVVDNPVTCSFECLHELRDMSANITLNSSVTTKDDVFISYDLPLDVRGEGQKLFLYTVYCNNKKSNICTTNEAEYIKSALLTVNYVLPTDEDQKKELVSDNFSYYLQLVENLSKLSDYNVLLAAELNVSINPFIHEFVKEELVTRSKLYGMWDSSLYYELYDSFQNINISELELVKSSMTSEKIDFINKISLYNDVLVSLNSFSDVDWLSNVSVIIDNSTNATLNSFIIDLNNTISSVNADSFSSYEDLFLDVLFLQATYDSLSSFYNTKILNVEQKLNDSVSLAKDYFLGLNRSMFSIPNNNCSSLDHLNSVVSLENQQSKIIFITNFSAVNSSVQKQLSDIYLSWLNGSSSSLDLSAFENVSSGNLSINFSTINQSLLKHIILIPEISNYYCGLTKPNVSVVPLIANNLIMPNISVPNNISLQDNPDICCYDGDCSQCCTAETCQDDYPVIFVHGHAISRGNLPEESHESFARMQRLLEDDGYVNAGEIGEGSQFNIPGGDWGRMVAPITVRVSYYYISYLDLGSYQLRTQRTDSIENYAIRLKELIDLVKYRTNKDKVNIVAHSMGGLVVRQYVALFGEDSINKVIILGTPDRGIEGRVKRLCSVTGASRECSEMDADSVFMKRINDPKNDFKTIEGYTITATGCDMAGEDGDGIVLARNVPLNFTTNLQLNGSCTDALESNLHVRFINPIYYPETFEMIRSILLN